MLSAKGTLSAWFKGTGRHIRADEDYSTAKEWSEEPSAHAIVTHESCKRFQKELSIVESLSMLDLRCFRGRTSPFIDGYPPTSHQMGPPKPEHTDENGRYNLKGFPALYLCDSITGVKFELEYRKQPIWIQNYFLKSTSLRIADLRKDNPKVSPFINCVFWFAESANKNSLPSLIFSQTIAQIVGEFFEAMIVPGVKGDDEQKYNNIVIFHPSSKWEEWLEEDPYEIGL
jgi:hypothetical protein